MEEWSDGMMEWWGDGASERLLTTPILHHSNIPFCLIPIS